MPHPFGIIERQPVRDPSPAIVPGQPEPGRIRAAPSPRPGRAPSARLAYGAWSAAEGGQQLRPYPGRSGQTTVKSRASRGATVRHIRCVSGKPCSSISGGPEPPQRAKMLVRLVWIVTVLKASKVIVAEAIRS